MAALPTYGYAIEVCADANKFMSKHPNIGELINDPKSKIPR
jgi:hypothetical protein